MTAVAALFFLDWDSLRLLSGNLGSLSTPAWVGLLALLALGILSEFLSVSVTVAENSGTSSIVFIPLLATLLLFGPVAAALFSLISAVFGEILIRHKPPLKATFNISQYFLSALVAGMVFEAFGGISMLVQTTIGESSDLHVLPFVGFIGTLLLLNNVSVAGAISISQGEQFIHVWKQLVGETGTNIVYDLLISPIAVAVAFLYREVGLLGLAVTILPLLFIRHSYLVNLKLQAAIRDLLSALVKAIETRDPYTSGHSLRVADLAERIARELGLPTSRVSDCKNAALLHDIGKINPIYIQILKKPGSLTEGERNVIESHVDKGVELVNSMASFPPNVIAGIRHHHERIDGGGYPGGLKGPDIPLEARIIHVCDAVDAMLSDRPYREALSVFQVREQLVQYAGTQFDVEIVQVVLESDILEKHKEAVRSENTLDPGIIGALQTVS